MDILGQSALIVAITSFALAMTALSRNLRNKLVIAYAVLCLTITSWAGSFFLEKIFRSGLFYQAHVVLSLWLAPVGLFFVRVLTRLDTRFLRWLYRSSVFYSLAVLALQVTVLRKSPFIRNLAFFAPSFLVLLCLYLMLNEWRLRRGYLRRVKLSTLGLSRRNWVYVGALVLLATAAMDHVRWLGEVIPSIGNILLCLYLFIISEVVIHQRLLNFSALLGRVVVLVSISLVFTLIYASLVLWIENAPALFVLNSFLASFILLLLGEPMKRLSSVGIRKLMSRKLLALEGKVADAQSQLVGILDTSGLAQLTLQFLDSVLSYESASVFLLRSDGSKFRRVRGVRDDALVNRELLVNHPMVEFFGKMRRKGEVPILLDHYIVNELDRTTSNIQRQNLDTILKGLAGLNASVLIPFMDSEKVLGFAAIRSANPPEAWGSSWGLLSELYPYFTQASRTLKNMDVFIRLREKDRLAALGEMSAGLAHEIRNPLGAIKGAAQLLQTTSHESELQRVIVEEVNRLNKVVTQFLDYSKPSSVADATVVDLRVLLDRTAAMYRSPEALPSGIQLGLLVSEPLTAAPTVKGSPEQLKQVVVNLIQNSIASLTGDSPRNEGVIRIGLETRRRSRDNVLEAVIFVEDNGKGIPRENLDRIFIPFFTTRTAGTGLGLPICQKIIESHGGRIEVFSDEGKTTRFSVYLPVSGE